MDLKNIIIIFSLVIIVIGVLVISYCFKNEKGRFKKEEKVEIKNSFDEQKEEKEEQKRDISSILKKNGIIKDYFNMDEEEKNEVMLKLMLLRDTYEITNEEYDEEKIKLWRK